VEQVKKALALDNKSLADATDEDVNAVIESFDSQLYQTHRLRSLMSRISGVLGAGGVEQVKKALALDNKSLADATDEDVNAVIESFDSQLYQTHRLRSLMSRIGNVLGCGGVKLVEDALGEMSLADVSDEELNAVITSLQSVAQGRKAYKTMSAEEESKLAEKARLHNEQCAKMYEEARNSTSNTFSEKTGMWSQPLPLRGKAGRAWSENEIGVIMSMKDEWHLKLPTTTNLASRLEGRSARQVEDWIRKYEKENGITYKK
jgi:hypothetical protein